MCIRDRDSSDSSSGMEISFMAFPLALQDAWKQYHISLPFSFLTVNVLEWLQKGQSILVSTSLPWIRVSIIDNWFLNFIGQAVYSINKKKSSGSTRLSTAFHLTPFVTNKGLRIWNNSLSPRFLRIWIYTLCSQNSKLTLVPKGFWNLSRTLSTANHLQVNRRQVWY